MNYPCKKAIPAFPHLCETHCRECGKTCDGADPNDIPIRGLGYANGWKPDGPQQAIVDRCRELGHKTTEERLRMHNYRYTCEKCGYRYQVDSS